MLGPVEVVAGERRARFESDRRQTILAVLLAAGGETVSTDRLIDAVWGPNPPSTARKSLQSHLSRLRSELAAVEPDDTNALLTQASGYSIDLRSHELDATRFETLVAQAREVAANDPERAAAILKDAQNMWRGQAFGALAAHPEVSPEAVRLEQLRAAAAADQIDTLLALGRHDDVVGGLEATVATDPLAERAHGQLMLALYRSGRQADALATYRHLHERLRDEVGIDPSPELRQLHERILRQDADLAVPPQRRTADDGRDALPRDRSSPDTEPIARLRPPTASGLLGRDADIASVTSMITDTRLVTLTGPGGVGKTRLAEQVAARVADRFDDGVVTCALAGVRDPDEVGSALITALGIQPTGERSAAETLVNALGDRQLLLMLDNCEHVLGPLTQLADTILAQCPNVVVLATSREIFHLPAERVWPVAPLAVPPPDGTTEEVAGAPAGELFVARAEAVEPTFSITDGNAGAVAELCRRLDGMPLAIELAAARTRALSPADLVARLDKRFSLLAGGPRREAGRHRTLQAVVEWSYSLLGATEAELFDRLSVFAGSFTLDAAEHICCGGSIEEYDVAGLLGELVDKSMVLVERDGTAVRYRLLDTLRDFGANRLAEAEATEEYRRAHAAYHVALVERLNPVLRGPDEHDAVAAIDGVMDDLRAAHTWLVSNGDVDGALRLPGALGDYTFYRLRDEVATWARRAVELPGAESYAAYPAALATAAFGATSRGECQRAHREGETALSYTRPTSLAGLAALVALQTAALYEGRLDDLLKYAALETETSERAGEPYYGAFAGLCRVLAHIYRGDQETAVTYDPDLQHVAAASRNPTMIAFALYGHGETHLDTSPDEAVA
ncbi:MAG: AfsR/SARP family transcriptional regulator, partial [Actinomycetota bacterium]